MKYVCVVPDHPYLLWQLELQIFNLKMLGELDKLTCVILLEAGRQPSEHAERLSKVAEVRFYENRQERRHYIPSNKPYGLMRLLEEFPEYGERLLLIDQDVIFRELLDFSKLDDDDTWYVSDSGVIGYIGYNYLNSMLGPELTHEMASLVGLTGERLKAEQPNSGGAQYYMKGVTADFCRQVVEDCYTIYDWSLKQKREDNSFKIQVWTAEMWAWLWNAFKVADVRIHPELNFAWAPHVLADWDRNKMLHMAGVTSEDNGAFFKGKYQDAPPWEVETNFDHIDRARCWWPYVQLIQAYKEVIDAS